MMDYTIILVAYLFVNVTPIFGAYIYMTNSYCDTEYNMDTYKTVVMEYKGSDILYSNPCPVTFKKTSYDHALCISAQQVILDCDTKLEYDTYFAKTYINPQKSITCTDTAVDEWCPEKFVSTILIVIRKPSRASSDYVRLLVNMKNMKEDDSYTPTAVILLAVTVPIAFLLVVIPLIVWKVRTRRVAAAQRHQVMNETTLAALDMQTAQPPNLYAASPPTPLTRA